MPTTQILPCRLTDDELQLRSNELAEKIQEWERAAWDKKQEAKKSKDECDALQKVVTELSRIVRNRAEDRSVEVQEQRTADRVRTIRIDTGEVIADRPLSPEERQGVLTLVAPLFTTEESVP